MNAVGGLLAGACCMLVIACASGQSAPPMAPAAERGQPTTHGPTAMPDDPRAEIDRLDRAIEAELTQLGLRPSAPPACIADGCGASAAEPMAVTPSGEDPTCKAGASDTCKDACTLSDSICGNAGRICRLAGELGGDDARANETCVRGKASCDASRARCCGCV